MDRSEHRTLHDWILRISTAVVMASCACQTYAQTHLPVKSKLATSLTAVSPAAGRSAPFVAHKGPEWAEAPPVLLPLAATRDSDLPGSCSRDADTLCYDYRQGRVVYKPARKLMPKITGLRRESLTLKRDKITLNYSFK